MNTVIGIEVLKLAALVAVMAGAVVWATRQTQQAKVRQAHDDLARSVMNRKWEWVAIVVRRVENGTALFWDGTNFTFRRDAWGPEGIGILLGSILHNESGVDYAIAAKYLMIHFRHDEIEKIIKVIGRRHRLTADILTSTLQAGRFSESIAWGSFAAVK